MSVTLKTRAMLWGRAAQRCSFPDCQIELVKDLTETDDESVVGEDCHIIAQSDKGPRGILSLSDEDKIKNKRLIDNKDKYANLILLCNVHHKIIDDQPNSYTIENLLQMKEYHESWVKDSLNSFDQNKQRDDEIYATYIEKWMQMIDIDNWEIWTSKLLSVESRISKEKFYELEELNIWLFKRINVGRYTKLDFSLSNFNLVLNDFLSVFSKHADSEFRENEIWTEKFYKSMVYNPIYDEQLKEYEDHIDLVHDLVLELTRAANYICDLVRKYIDSSFRINEGALIVHRGDHIFYTETIRPEYSEDQKKIDLPYENLEKFRLTREQRDAYVGKKSVVDDFRKS